MIEMHWHTGPEYRQKFTTPVDQDLLFKAEHKSPPLIVMSQREKDYLEGMRYMTGCMLEVYVVTDPVGKSLWKDAGFLSIRGLG